jgi:hypothetical protein
MRLKIEELKDKINKRLKELNCDINYMICHSTGSERYRGECSAEKETLAWMLKELENLH